jgi:hypothetical protein
MWKEILCVSVIVLLVTILVVMQRNLLSDMVGELKTNSQVYQSSIDDIESTEAEKLIQSILKKQEINLSY